MYSNILKTRPALCSILFKNSQDRIVWQLLRHIVWEATFSYPVWPVCCSLVCYCWNYTTWFDFYLSSPLQGCQNVCFLCRRVIWIQIKCKNFFILFDKMSVFVSLTSKPTEFAGRVCKINYSNVIPNKYYTLIFVVFLSIRVRKHNLLNVFNGFTFLLVFIFFGFSFLLCVIILVCIFTEVRQFIVFAFELCSLHLAFFPTKRFNSRTFRFIVQ